MATYIVLQRFPHIPKDQSSAPLRFYPLTVLKSGKFESRYSDEIMPLRSIGGKNNEFCVYNSFFSRQKCWLH